jgi:hypothetical protein
MRVDEIVSDRLVAGAFVCDERLQQAAWAVLMLALAATAQAATRNAGGLDHPGFKKAVESIAQAKGYLTEAEVEKIIEHCRVMTGGKINCD